MRVLKVFNNVPNVPLLVQECLRIPERTGPGGGGAGGGGAPAGCYLLMLLQAGLSANLAQAKAVMNLLQPLNE